MKKYKLPKGFILTRINLDHHYFVVIYYKDTLYHIQRWQSTKNFSKKIYNKFKKDLRIEKKEKVKFVETVKPTTKVTIKKKDKERKYFPKEDIIQIPLLEEFYKVAKIELSGEDYYIKYLSSEHFIEQLEICISHYENQLMDVIYDRIAMETFMKKNVKSIQKKKYKRKMEKK